MALPVGEFLALEHGTEFWGVDRAELQVRHRHCFYGSQHLHCFWACRTPLNCMMPVS